MSIFIKKKFIGDGEVDGAKILVLNNQAVRAENSSGAAVELFKLDSSNVLQFVQMPQVSSDPSAGNHLARKSYVDAQDAAEAAARASAVSGLESAIDAEEARALAAEAALQAEIEAEAAARAAAITSEATAREAADTALSVALDAETAARTAADSDLQDAIDAEAAARAAEDAAINTRIDNVLSNIDPEALDSLTEIVAAFQAADSSLEGTISSLAASASTDLEAETAAREAADSALQAAIDAEVSAREAADAVLQGAIDDEVARATAAEEALDEAKASRELDNLQNTALNVDLLPGMDREIHLGNDTLAFDSISVEKIKADGYTYVHLMPDGGYLYDITGKETIVWDSQGVVLSAEGIEQLRVGSSTFEGSGAQVSGYGLQAGGTNQNIGSPTQEFALGYFGHVHGSMAPVEEDHLTRKDYVDQEILTAVSAEEAAREAAISAETAAREAADSALQAAIDAEIARASGAEADALAAAESYTDSEISALKGDVSSTYDTLKKIEDKIEFIVSNTDPAALDSLAEIVSAFQGADGDINAAISSLAASASADLAAETAAREAADAAEASARQDADDALDARLDALEADPTTKTYVDAQVASEAAARIAGDAVLQAAIDAVGSSLASFQPAAPEVFTLSAGDIANQYVELSVDAVVANSVEVRVNRMFALPSEFTQSSGTAGKVRLSFAGALASAGAQALVAGDTLVVRYWVE